MPVQIGATTHSFSDPTGLLSDCHRRIEMFLGTLEAAAAVIDCPATEETGLEVADAPQRVRSAQCQSGPGPERHTSVSTLRSPCP